MNWYVVQCVTLIACCMATVVSFAVTMANVEYGLPRVAAIAGGSTLVLFAADALLLGSVWA